MRVLHSASTDTGSSRGDRMRISQTRNDAEPLKHLLWIRNSIYNIK